MADINIFVGPAVHSDSPEEITCFPKVAIAVKDGKIVDFAKDGDIKNIKKIEVSKAKVIKLEEGQFLCPGFLDIHLHAPQYPNIGLGYDKPLLDWLRLYTWPLEMRYSDTDFAKQVYESVVKSTLRCGTTTACYYGTIHQESSFILAEIASRYGQRAIVGKVNMNQNSFPEYIETTEASLADTKEFIEKVIALDNPLVEPAVTPRFAISCNFDLLKGLGELAKKYNAYVQTHLCESKSEIAYTEELFPECKNYTDIYHKSGLLTNKTILGHGVYLSEEDCKILSSTGTAIAHCASSNSVLQSGLCPVRDIWEAGVTIGLGTDVSGGSNLCILDAMRSALTTSIHLAFTKSDYKPLTYHEVFYLATLGGAKALSKEDQIGNFKIGKCFDALLVDMNLGSPAGVFPSHDVVDLIQKFIYCGDDRNIKEVYVNGKVVSRR
ncbi:guanine deaminase isoform X2 [Halyomorpha halys]|uniref:guanine deaminase isoform X2 n=1 Tax=Halyomorpha halys TaxID=286706 RepID=UPI000D0C8DA4|nr:guanine deaminase isoform X2 [Halyomorpha halys]